MFKQWHNGFVLYIRALHEVLHPLIRAFRNTSGVPIEFRHCSKKEKLVVTEKHNLVGLFMFHFCAFFIKALIGKHKAVKKKKGQCQFQLWAFLFSVICSVY